MVVSFSSDNPTDLSTWIDISQHLVHPSWPGKDCVITEPIEPPPCAPNADYSSVSDIGLAILSRPVPDIAPVTLPEVDALLASAGHVTMVGYGCSADREFKRNYSTATLASVSNYRAFYNPAPASICNGDSGGPSFLEDRVLSIHSAHDGLLNNDARVDISSALDWIKSVIASVEPPPGTQQAVEYYYADWNFYFVTSDAAEIAALDGGAFGGLWRRTGQTFTVWTSPTNGALPTCRFFSVIFAPRSSHFYTDRANECVALKQNPGWQYEAIAFYLQPLNAGFDCPAGTIILYRLFNNGKDGAPNHRFITDEAQVAAMIAEGWSLEGDGPKTAYACVLATAIPGGVVR
jgi:hypothetical protein